MSYSLYIYTTEPCMVQDGFNQQLAFCNIFNIFVTFSAILFNIYIYIQVLLILTTLMCFIIVQSYKLVYSLKTCLSALYLIRKMQYSECCQSANYVQNMSVCVFLQAQVTTVHILSRALSVLLLALMWIDLNNIKTQHLAQEHIWYTHTNTFYTHSHTTSVNQCNVSDLCMCVMCVYCV